MELLNGLLLITASMVWGQLCEHQWKGEFADQHVDGVPYLQAKEDVQPPPLEIRPPIVNGPSSNRIDIVFLGDRCTYRSLPVIPA